MPVYSGQGFETFETGLISSYHPPQWTRDGMNSILVRSLCFVLYHWTSLTAVALSGEEVFQALVGYEADCNYSNDFVLISDYEEGSNFL